MLPLLLRYFVPNPSAGKGGGKDGGGWLASVILRPWVMFTMELTAWFAMYGTILHTVPHHVLLVVLPKHYILYCNLCCSTRQAGVA
jgi:hypothetical protein